MRYLRSTGSAKGFNTTINYAIALLSTIVFVILIEGCAAIMGLSVVGIVGWDTMRSSRMHFEPFEETWLALPTERYAYTLRSLAIVPFLEGPALEAILTSVLQEASTVRVISPSEVAEQVSPEAIRDAWASIIRGDGGYAESVATTLQVDGMLLGQVISGPAKESLWPWKTVHPKRLYLCLVSRSGKALWKTQLPFTIVKGPKPLSDESISNEFRKQMRTEAETLGLTDMNIMDNAS
jgi:hypothetical protein